MTRVESATRPARHNEPGFLLFAAFPGHGAMFTTALAMAFVARPIAF